MKILEHLKKEDNKKDEDKGEAKKKVRRACKFIEPIAVNFRRTLQGNKLIRQELRRLLDKQKVVFATRPMWNADQSEVSYNDCGESKIIGAEALMMRAPYFFSAIFSTIRNKLLFGTKVQQWFADVLWISNSDFRFGFLWRKSLDVPLGSSN